MEATRMISEMPFYIHKELKDKKKPKTKTEKLVAKRKIEYLEDKIQKNKDRIRKIGYEKSAITKKLNKGQIKVLAATKAYQLKSNLQKGLYHFIEDDLNQIRIINNDPEMAIPVKGIFANYYVKRKTLLDKTRNPALYLLNREKQFYAKFVEHGYSELKSIKQLKGYETQFERVENNIRKIKGEEVYMKDSGSDKASPIFYKVIGNGIKIELS